jgi:uncharacterized protein (DUF1501 family)
MFNRRDFLKNTSLLTFSGAIPEFLARTAQAAAPGKETILVVLEMNGGNDGLNTVIPYADERYYELRPTLGIKKKDLIVVNDWVGLHPDLSDLASLLDNNQLAIVQGVGYPNHSRSHFESTDAWQFADPKRQQRTGWLARAAAKMTVREGGVLGMQVGPGKMPAALSGGQPGLIALGDPETFQLTLNGRPDRRKARRQLIDDLVAAPAADADDTTAFVRRRQLQSLQAANDIAKDLNTLPTLPEPARSKAAKSAGPFPQLHMVARLIQKDLGARLFYVALPGFDTHAQQAKEHVELFRTLGRAIKSFFDALHPDHDKRVLLMTFSEFGRRAQENASRGTDHGAASCLFVAGPAVKPGTVGDYPDLGDLESGDLKFTLDFRRVYATLLDQWLQVDSKLVLGDEFEHVNLLAKK